MPPIFRKQDGLLAKVNFPLYSVQMLTSRHVLVAGGGGSSNTGVANGFEILEISHDGKHFIAEKVIRHETGPSPVMNCAAYSNNHHMYLVSGQENHSQLYTIKSSIVDDEKENVENHTTNNVRQRKNGNSAINDLHNSNIKNKRLTFEIKASDSIQTDFSIKSRTVDPLQNVVRISPNGHLMATGGTDGHVRLWQFPQLNKITDIAAHSKEVDDLDFDRRETQVVSVSKDGTAVIWNVKDGKKIHDLTWPTPEGIKYIHRRCRFGAVEEDKNKSRLFMLTNPVGVSPKRVRSYLQLWDPSEGKLKRQTLFKDLIASLAVRDDGRFVAVGTMFTGSVDIFIAFSLQRVLHVDGAHSTFVTGVEFLPVTSEKHPVKSTAEAAVISISVDNRVCIHTLYHRHSIPSWIAITLIVLTLFLTFAFCSFIGL